MSATNRRQRLETAATYAARKRDSASRPASAALPPAGHARPPPALTAGSGAASPPNAGGAPGASPDRSSSGGGSPAESPAHGASLTSFAFSSFDVSPHAAPTPAAFAARAASAALPRLCAEFTAAPDVADRAHASLQQTAAALTKDFELRLASCGGVLEDPAAGELSVAQRMDRVSCVRAVLAGVARHFATLRPLFRAAGAELAAAVRAGHAAAGTLAKHEALLAHFDAEFKGRVGRAKEQHEAQVAALQAQAHRREREVASLQAIAESLQLTVERTRAELDAAQAVNREWAEKVRALDIDVAVKRQALGQWSVLSATGCMMRSASAMARALSRKTKWITVCQSSTFSS